MRAGLRVWAGWIAMAWLAGGCPADGDDGGASNTATGSPTLPGETTVHANDTTAATSSAATAGGSSGTGGASSSSGGFGAIFDVNTRADVGGPPPIEITCDNIDEVTATSIGCEFYGVDLEMLSSNELAYGISVGNPTSEIATVVIEDMRGPGNTLREITTLMVDPDDSVLVEINGMGGLLAGQDHQVSPGANPLAAFHIQSDVPITAMQINPVGGGPSHVAEASLLLPVNALDTSYFAVGHVALLGPSDGYVAVVATTDGTTINTTGGSTTIDAYDVQVYTTSDATGFFVGADAPVAVFSGTTCTYIPTGQGACDHLEEQVVPAASWGTTYVGGRHPVRITASNNTPENVVWRVIAGVDNTTITFTPPVTGPIALATAGSYQEFSTSESFLAQGDQPFMLVQYMTGCTNVVPVPLDPGSPCNEPATGDPYMIQMPPVDQWLDALPFLTDTSYPRDFVVMMREQGTVIDLACLGVVDASHFTAIAGTPYEVGTVDLDAVGGGEGSCVDGEQFLSASAPIGVIVGGMDWATSYGYAGGLAFSGLWVPPTEPPG